MLAQEELNSIWQKRTNRTEHNNFDEREVSAMGGGLLLKVTGVTNADTEQAMTVLGSLGGVASYTEFDPPSDTPIGTYTRIRDNKEELWTAWKKR